MFVFGSSAGWRLTKAVCTGDLGSQLNAGCKQDCFWKVEKYREAECELVWKQRVGWIKELIHLLLRVGHKVDTSIGIRKETSSLVFCLDYHGQECNTESVTRGNRPLHWRHTQAT
jgi:hypothetical protein